MKQLLLALVLLWPVAGLADWQAGLDAAQRGDFATAMREWRPLAEQGVAKAQYGVGVLYRDGEGVPEDDTEAVRWFRKAAEQGTPLAQHELGRMYANGDGVPADIVQAYAWWSLAATQGDKAAVQNQEKARGLMTTAQLTEAQNLSKSLCAKIPDCGE